MFAVNLPPAFPMFWFALVSSVLSLVAGAPDWVWPTAIDWVWLIVLGALGGVAQVLVTRAWRLAPAAILAPFDYSSIVLALLYGYLWFHEEPPWTVWLGLPPAYSATELLADMEFHWRIGRNYVRLGPGQSHVLRVETR